MAVSVDGGKGGRRKAPPFAFFTSPTLSGLGEKTIPSRTVPVRRSARRYREKRMASKRRLTRN